MLKRIVSLLLCVAMLISVCALAGCGNEGKKPVDNDGSGTEQNNDQRENDFFLDMPSELRGTTVQFATWIGHDKTDTAICLSGFEETTGMTLELVQVNEADYVVKMSSLIAADQSPDVVVENGSFPKTLNLLMPLEVETTGLDVTDPFWDQDVVKKYTVGKYAYLVNGERSSWNIASQMTYFNKTILAENGILNPNELVEQNNWNVDSVWTLMEQIKAACGFSRPGTSIVFDGWLAMYGGSQIIWDQENDVFKTNIKSENTRKAIDYLMKGQDAGLLKIIPNHDDDITKGNIALQICGAYGLRKSPGWFYTMDLDDLGFEVLPKLNATDSDYPYTTFNRAYGICLGANNPKGAAYFLRYFLNEDHYDLDQIFKNEEAKQLYFELREKGDINKTEGYAAGVGRVVDPSYTCVTMVKDLLDGTAAQVSVNLDKACNKCEGSVAAANKLVQEIIDNQ